MESVVQQIRRLNVSDTDRRRIRRRRQRQEGEVIPDEQVNQQP